MFYYCYWSVTRGPTLFLWFLFTKYFHYHIRWSIKDKPKWFCICIETHTCVCKSAKCIASLEIIIPSYLFEPKSISRIFFKAIGLLHISMHRVYCLVITCLNRQSTKVNKDEETSFICMKWICTTYSLHIYYYTHSVHLDHWYKLKRTTVESRMFCVCFSY